MSRLFYLVCLTGIWCALWSDLSVANVASGVVISLILLAAFGSLDIEIGPINVVAFGKFVLLVAKDAVLSTVSVASEIVTPTDYTDELVASVELPGGAERHLLLLTIAVTLTPGTAVTDTDPNVPSLTVHLLHADRLEATRSHIIELAELANAAWPHSPDSVHEVPQ